MDCGSLLPLSARQPAVSRGGLEGIAPQYANAIRRAAGCMAKSYSRL
jgi:hypothetical protein